MPFATDFNGDGCDDLLLVSQSTPRFHEWLARGDGSFEQFSEFTETDWNAPATGDFNGDGHDDILLRDLLVGSISSLLSYPDGQFYRAPIHYPLDLSWHVSGVGDFNGDRRDDLLLRNDNGTVTEWLGQPDGTFVSNHATATSVLPAGWHVVGTGDFNGDSRSDVLLENDDRIVTEWLGQVDGSFFSNHAVATSVLPAGWHVAATGDFNGDTHDDILLVQNDGTVTEWLTRGDGSFDWNAAATYSLPSGWHVTGTGNYNNDAFDDVLLRHDNGTITNWLGQQHGSFFSNHVASTLPMFTSWEIQSNRFDGWI